MELFNTVLTGVTLFCSKHFQQTSKKHSAEKGNLKKNTVNVMLKNSIVFETQAGTANVYPNHLKVEDIE